jgi:hypothetical protein
MSNLAFHQNHFAWQQRVKKELDHTIAYNNIVEKIRDNRPDKHKEKAI